MNKDLSGAFGDKGTKVNAIAYGHPHTEEIIESARAVIRESQTGVVLLRVMDHFRIPVQIIKGNGESGFNPELKVIFLQVPGNIKKATTAVIFNIIKALREADQEYAGFKAPDPLKDVIEYAGFMHARNLDSITHICKVAKELTETSHIPDLLDTLAKLGLDSVYKAYLKGASREELYDEYANAYDTNRRSV